MGFNLSSNMNLPIPVVGGEPGPTYAEDINNALTLVDAHDHSPGSGVQITPSGLNINTTLDFQGNGLVNVALISLTAQSSTPDVSTIYQSGDDLYFVDALGNNIQITANGGIAGSPGSISNLVSPASAAYVSGSSKFVWQSDTNIAANMDFGSAIMRNISPNSTFALTLSPPASLGSNFTITLPTIPVASAFLIIDNAGAITGSIATANGITASNIAAGTITNTQISASAGIVATKLAPVWNTVEFSSGSSSWTVPSGVTYVIAEACAGGGGGGGGGGQDNLGAQNQGGSGGGGGEGVESVLQAILTTPGESIAVVVGSGGAGGAGAANDSNGALATAGSTGGSTTITALASTLTINGGAGGGAGQSGLRSGTQTPGGAGGSRLPSAFAGGAGGHNGNNNSAGVIGTAGILGITFTGGSTGSISGGSGSGGAGGGGGPSSYGNGQNAGNGSPATSSTYYRFTITSGNSAVIGAIYSNNGHNYTLLQTLSTTDTIAVFSGAAAPTSSGTLTYVSGTHTGGNIAFSAVTSAADNAANPTNLIAGSGGGGGGGGTRSPATPAGGSGGPGGDGFTRISWWGPAS